MTLQGPSGNPALLWAHRLAGADRRTGVGRYVVELTRALVEAHGAGSSLRYTLCAGPEAEPASWIPPGVDVRRLGPNRLLLHAAWAVARRPTIERFAGPAALVHALAPSFPVPSRAPLVVTVHDLFPLEHPRWSGRVVGWANRRGLRWAIDHADHLVADSEHVRSRMIDAGVEPERVTACPLGISGRFAEPVSSPARDEVLGRLRLVPGGFVLAVGAVTARKDLPTVIAALAQVPVPMNLVITGPAADAQAHVLAAITRHGLEERVRLAGFVSDDTLRALMATTLALVHPSLDEGFGLTPLEAMAAGTPAIVAASGSLPETVGEAAVVIAGRDPDAWAEAITRLRDEPAVRDALGNAARIRARGFTWARTAAATAAVHRHVIATA